jgi:hypothetical protein
MFNLHLNQQCKFKRGVTFRNKKNIVKFKVFNFANAVYSLVH